MGDRLQNPMGWRTKIASKKALATVKIALTVFGIMDLNAGIEYLKVLPEQKWVFENRKVLVESAKDSDFEAGEAIREEVGVDEVEVPEVKFEGEFSAYTASEDETDADPFVAASGKRVFVGMIACPKKYQFGTKIKVDGMGEYVCEDRMNERYREKENFDIFFPTKSEAFAFGRRTLEFQVLD